MPIVIEKEGKTVDDAIRSACYELGLMRNDVDVEVLQEEARGVLGIGSKNARVRVTVIRLDLSDKGLRAKKSLETLLSHFIPNPSVSIKETADRIKLDVKADDETGLLIGKKGEMLAAMEFIIGKIASRLSKDGKEKRIVIDVGGYKKRREEIIVKIVREAAHKVRRSGRAITLEPMSPHERKIAYFALKQENGLKFETRRGGDEKRITISSADSSRNRESLQKQS